MAIAELDLVASAVPRNRDEQWAQYYADTDAKHLALVTGGSTFTDPALTRLEDVVALTLAQRGTLDGDDRAAFAALGAQPDAFRDDARYLLVRTPGVLGAARASALHPDTLVHLIQDKVGVPVALVADVTKQPRTDFGTVILVHDADLGHDIVITAFPGEPAPPRDPSPLDELAGTSVTLAEATAIIGHDRYAVMTRVAG